MAHSVIAVENRQQCAGCPHGFEDGDVVIAVASGVVDGDSIVPQAYDWYHVGCWTPLPQRQAAEA